MADLDLGVARRNLQIEAALRIAAGRNDGVACAYLEGCIGQGRDATEDKDASAETTQFVSPRFSDDRAAQQKKKSDHQTDGATGHGRNGHGSGYMMAHEQQR